MGTSKLTTYVDRLLKFTERNTPSILTGFGVLGVFETAILSYKAGAKGKKIMEAKRKDLKDVLPEDKAAKRAVLGEMVKEMTPVVAPPVAMGIATSACIIGANHVSSRRLAAISAAYSLTETALKDYRHKTEEIIGERKAMQIKEAIAKDKVQSNPPPKDSTQIVVTGDGNVLCYDAFSGRYFRSNAQKIGAAINKMSYECQSTMYISLNEFWDEIGLQRLPMGSEFGWNIDNCSRGQLPILMTAVLTEEQEPCLCVDYDIYPRIDFRDFH